MASQKEFVWIFLGFFLVVVVLGVSFIGGNPFSTIGTASGLTPLSMGQASFSSNDPNSFFTGSPMWVFSAVQGGLGQSLQGTLTADQIKDPLNNTQAQRGFSLQLDNLGEFCRYPLRSDYSHGQVFTYTVLKQNALEGKDTFLQRCNSTGNLIGYQAQNYPLLANSAFYCVTKTPVSSYSATFENGGYNFSTNFTLAVDGQLPVTKNIQTLGAGDITDLGGIAYVKWVGNFSSGNTCPSPLAGDNGVRALYKGTSWQLVNNVKINEYYTAENQFELEMIDPTKFNFDSATLRTGTINNISVAAMAPASYNYSGQTLSAVNATSQPNAYYFLNLDDQIQFPTFAFYVKADKLGFFQPVGKVSNLTAQGVTIKTADKGLVQVSYDNSGTISANFYISLSCPNTFSTPSTITRTTSNGAHETVNLEVGAICSATTNVDCTVHVKPAGSSSDSTYPVRNTCLIQPTCLVPGAKRCTEDNKIFACSQDGSNPNVLVDDCGSKGQLCDPASFTCKNTSDKAVCGNNVCEVGETKGTCPSDCTPHPPVCEFLQVPRTTPVLFGILGTVQDCIYDAGAILIFGLLAIGGLAGLFLLANKGGRRK